MHITSMIVDISQTELNVKSIEKSFASILDNIYDNGYNDDFFSEEDWTKASLCEDSVCAPDLQRYKDTSNGL